MTTTGASPVRRPACSKLPLDRLIIEVGSSMRGIVVIDQPVDDRVVGWHVSAGDTQASTVTGAWVLPVGDPRIGALLVDRVVITTGRAVGRFGPGADAAMLGTAIGAEIGRLDAAISARENGRSLSRPRWPRVPHRPAASPTGDPLAGAAPALARWVAELLTAWRAVEEERLAHPVLAVRGGDIARPFPPGWGTARNEQLAA